MTTYEKRLRTFLRDRFPGFDELSDDDADLSATVDSLGLFDVVAFVEQEFGVQVPTEEFSPQKFSSIRKILEFVSDLESR